MFSNIAMRQRTLSGTKQRCTITPKHGNS